MSLNLCRMFSDFFGNTQFFGNKIFFDRNTLCCFLPLKFSEIRSLGRISSLRQQPSNKTHASMSAAASRRTSSLHIAAGHELHVPCSRQEQRGERASGPSVCPHDRYVRSPPFIFNPLDPCITCGFRLLRRARKCNIPPHFRLNQPKHFVTHS